MFMKVSQNLAIAHRVALVVFVVSSSVHVIGRGAYVHLQTDRVQAVCLLACVVGVARRSALERGGASGVRGGGGAPAAGTSPSERGHSPKHTDFSGKNNGPLGELGGTSSEVHTDLRSAHHVTQYDRVRYHRFLVSFRIVAWWCARRHRPPAPPPLLGRRRPRRERGRADGEGLSGAAQPAPPAPVPPYPGSDCFGLALCSYCSDVIHVQPGGVEMDAVYPATASALARGRRVRRAGPRHRHRTTPVTFAEIKEVDEESCEAEACEERCGGGAGSARRRPDVLEERLGPQFAEFRRRRAHQRDVLREREREHESPPPAPRAAAAAPALARAGSEPAALHRRDAAGT